MSFLAFQVSAAIQVLVPAAVVSALLITGLAVALWFQRRRRRIQEELALQ